MNIAAVSIFYNTKQLLKPLYQSYINNSGVISDFYVYDNSNDVSQQLTDSDIENTCIQLRYIPHEVIHNMIGSKMHAKSIQFAFDDLLSLYDYIILLDSDVIITGSISDIIDQMEMENYDIAGWKDGAPGYNRNHIHPSFMLIKTKNILANDIKFFDNTRICIHIGNGFTYDTGMSFYEDIIKNQLNVLEIPFNCVYNHFGSGSRHGTKNSHSTHTDMNQWLEDLYEYYK